MSLSTTLIVTPEKARMSSPFGHRGVSRILGRQQQPRIFVNKLVPVQRSEAQGPLPATGRECRGIAEMPQFHSACGIY